MAKYTVATIHDGRFRAYEVHAPGGPIRSADGRPRLWFDRAEAERYARQADAEAAQQTLFETLDTKP